MFNFLIIMYKSMFTILKNKKFISKVFYFKLVNKNFFFYLNLKKINFFLINHRRGLNQNRRVLNVNNCSKLYYLHSEYYRWFIKKKYLKSYILKLFQVKNLNSYKNIKYSILIQSLKLSNYNIDEYLNSIGFNNFLKKNINISKKKNSFDVINKFDLIKFDYINTPNINNSLTFKKNNFISISNSELNYLNGFFFIIKNISLFRFKIFISKKFSILN
jgi:hypothetical protein